jgi:hypothetical protein
MIPPFFVLIHALGARRVEFFLLSETSRRTAQEAVRDRGHSLRGRAKRNALIALGVDPIPCGAQACGLVGQTAASKASKKAFKTRSARRR